MLRRLLLETISTSIKQPVQVSKERTIMSFCAWSKGEIYKDHFEHGK